jgi:hypothetical protein
MKIRAVLSLTLVAAALGAAPAAAQNMTGTWTIRSQGGRGSMTQIVELAQDGSTLTGTVSFEGGRGRGGPGGGQPIEISNGSVDGASFTFTVTFEMGGRGAVSTTYTGTYEADFMEGTINGPRGGGQPFMGTRAD